jgi:putative tryptophan/tyrosine transport system substrate-binding protein
MSRREFIALLGGAAAAWPLAARAQQDGRVRRAGWLIGGTEGDAGPRASVAALREGLAKLGWIEGRNLHFEFRFGAGDLGRMRTGAAELVSSSEVIVTSQTAAARVAQEQTKTIPIVFTTASDPVVTGLVQNIARPEGNITGFGTTEPSIAGKWLGLLKEAAPNLSRVAVIFNPETGLGAPGYVAAIEAAAPALSVEAVRTPVRDAVDVVRAIDAFAATPNGGLLVLTVTGPEILAPIHRLSLQHRMPAIYQGRTFVQAGGLMSYGTDAADLARRAASYVDRLLRGAKVSELVQRS